MFFAAVRTLWLDAEEHIERVRRLSPLLTRIGALRLISRIASLQRPESTDLLPLDIERLRGEAGKELVKKMEALAAPDSPLLSKLEVAFLYHAKLNERIREWAGENDVTYIDTIAALDGRRDVLMSWVHLDREGNTIIAEALSGPILEKTCKPPASPRSGS